MKKTEIVAKTITPLYDELEDRLRIVINYESLNERIDFMVTRSFIINLVPSIEEYIFTHYHEEPVEVAQVQAQSSQNQNREHLSKTDNTDLVLLRTQEELLIKINLSYLPDSKETLFSFFSKNQSSKTKLNGAMLQQVLKTIKSSIPYFKWGISHNF